MWLSASFFSLAELENKVPILTFFFLSLLETNLYTIKSLIPFNVFLNIDFIMSMIECFLFLLGIGL